MAKDSLLFRYLGSINDSKVDYLLKENSEEAERFKTEYTPYVINTGLSLFPDTIMLANEMNVARVSKPERHFVFLLHSVRKRRRFSKNWPKNVKPSPEVAALAEYYEISHARAKEYLPLHSEEELKEIVESMVGSDG